MTSYGVPVTVKQYEGERRRLTSALETASRVAGRRNGRHGKADRDSDFRDVN